MNDGNDWIVDIDLEKFFDTVNHDKLMTIIGRTIKDGDVISIIRKYLVSGIMIDDEYEDSIVGTPQGEIFRRYWQTSCSMNLIRKWKSEGLTLCDMQMTVLSWLEVKCLQIG